MLPAHWSSSLFLLVFAALAGSVATSTLAADDRPVVDPVGQAREVLVVGRVSNNPRKDYPGLKTLADYLVARLGDAGINRAEVQFTDDNAKMVELLRRGSIDLVFDTVFPALAYQDEAGAKLLLREWRDGKPTYRSVLFKRKDSPIMGLADLVGRKLAFERPGSTSSYFVPKAELLSAGFRPRKLDGPNEPMTPNGIGYVFAGSENNLVVWVHRGLVDAGAFSDIDWDQPEDMPPELKKDLEIFYWSEPLPRALVVARQGLPPTIEERIKRSLLEAAADPAGKAALEERKVTRYDELNGEAAAGVRAARRLSAYTH